MTNSEKFFSNHSGMPAGKGDYISSVNAREYARLKSQEDNEELVEALRGARVTMISYYRDMYIKEHTANVRSEKIFFDKCEEADKWALNHHKVKEIDSLIAKHTPKG